MNLILPIILVYSACPTAKAKKKKFTSCSYLNGSNITVKWVDCRPYIYHDNVFDRGNATDVQGKLYPSISLN